MSCTRRDNTRISVGGNEVWSSPDSVKLLRSTENAYKVIEREREGGEVRERGHYFYL